MRASRFLPLVWLAHVYHPVCHQHAGAESGEGQLPACSSETLSSSRPLKPVPIAVKESIGSIITRVPQPSTALVTVSLVLLGSACEEHSSEEACFGPLSA